MAECPLIIEDFVSSDWQKVLLSANEQTIYSYTGAFAAAESQSRDAGDLSKARVFGFLRTITSLRRNFDSSSEPYVPAITLANGWRSTSMDDISEFEIKLIEKLAPDIADPELKAYFNDLLWLKTRAHTAARNAIHLFLASAHHLECSAHWSECVARLQRAAVLAVSIGARKSELRVVSLRISETIDRISATDNGFASHSLMLVLLGVKEGDPHKWAPLCEVLAHRAEAAGKWQVARAYWGLKADWHGCAKEAAKQKEARLLSAETYVSESDCVLAMPRPSRFWAANLLAQAVEALRNAGATSTYVDEIHRRLLAIQSSAMEEMQTIPTNQIDISEHIRISQQVVRGRSVREAIAVLCRFMDPVKESETKARVEASTKKFLFIHLIGREFVNAEGKSIARAPGA